MSSTLVLGSTGKTGSQILTILLSLPQSQVSSITTISRRPPTTTTAPAGAPPLTPHLDSDTSKWASLIPTNVAPKILFSALATTRGAAGSFQSQYELDHDLNIALARTAREAGTSTYVLISVANASLSSPFAYPKMKAEIERDILALDFEHTVILRPGLIGGRRQESRPAEAVLRYLADGLGYVSGGRLKDFWTQDADVIGRAAVRAGLKAAKGEGSWAGKVSVLNGKEIMEVGRAGLTEEETAGR